MLFLRSVLGSLMVFSFFLKKKKENCTGSVCALACAPFSALRALVVTDQSCLIVMLNSSLNPSETRIHISSSPVCP